MLGLLSSYTRKDWLAALERAVRYGAYSAQAVERILAAQAQPKSALEALADQEWRPPEPLRDEPVTPRSPAEYQQLCEEVNDHGQANGTHPSRQRPTVRRPGRVGRTCVNACSPTLPSSRCR